MKSFGSSNRGLAAEILLSWEEGQHTASELLEQTLPEAESRGQVTDLVLGVLRNRTLLDTVLTAAAELKPSFVEKDLMTLLRLGAFELLFCPDTAEYAVVNETASLAGKQARRRGFINAVLRRVQRLIENRRCPREGSDLRRWIPAKAGTGCLLKEPLLPDPDSQMLEYCSMAFSIPKWLAERWLAAYGADNLPAVCAASNRIPAIILQPNLLKTTAPRLAELLKSEAVHAELNAEQTMLRIHTHRYLPDLWTFQKGYFFIQDPTAARAASMLPVQPGSVVLDFCAAPGGKTVQLAMKMKNQGRILAVDADSRRLQKVEENCRRLEISCVQCVRPEQIKEALGAKNKVAAVLLDVPCSNTGVMARRVEVRWRLKPESIPEMVQTQKDLLEQAAGFVRKHGTLVYSTCSILPEENQQVVQDFLARHPLFTLEQEELTLPSCGSQTDFGHDGGYAALLRKT
ncbi:MAG TPA: transcription antitermination factor NusB [Anaerohalosphaeraceae bacterium]|nr:transcription antitermination factor NusB [Anaerohalosphaeraceae bacterium]HOL87823.1 transcription antitermination factor NusB [Anaerohalosphaeraceae bacterium]